MKRIFAGRSAPLQFTDAVAALFLGEFLQPSPQLFLHASRLDNSPVIDNRMNAFRTFLPDLGHRVITLAEALVELARRGTNIDLLVADARSVSLLETMKNLLAGSSASGRISLLVADNAPGQGLLGRVFLLQGDWSWAPAGLSLGPTPPVLETTTESVAQAQRLWSTFWDENRNDAEILS